MNFTGLARSASLFVGLWALSIGAAAGQELKPKPPAKNSAAPKAIAPKIVEPKAAIKKAELSTGSLKTEDWFKTDSGKLQPGEIDHLVNAHLAKANIKPSALTSDEQFIRRVYLDLTGRLPVPLDIRDFLADKSPDKRAKLIDSLLETPDYAEHWGNYWRNVIVSKTSDQRTILNATRFEKWMKEQFAQNRKWSEIATDMITAKGEMRRDVPNVNGEAFFMLSRFGADSATEIAAETSRIFLGIQIQCAQCHDHPSDVWKRHHFHEFAAHFARRKEAPIFENKQLIGQKLVSLPFAEHRMPDRDEPKKTTVIHPKFLDGKQTVGKFAKDDERRKALAAAIVDKSDPWFAAAYVNRIWGELLGTSFYMPIDDLGPEKEAVMPEVVARLAASFRATDYDVKQFFRDVMNSETYQRRIRPSETTDEQHAFASNQPTRLGADALWLALTTTLGSIQQPPIFGSGAMMKKGPFLRLGGIEGTFKQEFGFDPSLKADEVEESVSQVLLMMNNPAIQGKISARGTNLLARVLQSYPNNDEALDMVYLRSLARRPTDRERQRCIQHLRSATSRNEGFEDVLWALINSAEYQSRR